MTDQEYDTLSFKIIPLLNGIPLGEACHILKNTRAILMDFHIVDTEGPRFKMKLEEFGVSLASSDQ